MLTRRRGGLALTVVLAVAAAVVANGAPAGAVYGMLGHYEVCQSNGDYGYIPTLSVRENVVAGERGDEVIHILTRSGRPVGTIAGTGRPDDEKFRDLVVGTSPSGTIYVVTDSIGSGYHLYKFNGRALEREFDLHQGPFGMNGNLVSPVGLFGSRPGSRESKTGEVVVGDAVGGLVIFESDGTFNEGYRFTGGATRGRLEGISAVPPGFIVLALSSDTEGVASEVAVLGGNKPIRSGYNFKVGTNYIMDVAGAPDGTVWAIGQSNSGFSGLEHFTHQGDLLDRVAIDGALHGVGVGPDGEVWVSRADGLLRIGRNGGTIPKDQYGYGKCGAPQVQTEVPGTQQILASRRILVLASGDEQLTVHATGKLFAGREFKLKAVKRKIAPGEEKQLKLKFSQKAADAIARRLANDKVSRLQIKLRATDAAKTKSSRTLRLTIG